VRRRDRERPARHRSDRGVDDHMNEVVRRERPRAPFWFDGADAEAWAPGVAATETHGHNGD
ncbi:hypothetical protein LTR94_021920, partial [Friedmanniomyces endolithicus]